LIEPGSRGAAAGWRLLALAALVLALIALVQRAGGGDLLRLENLGGLRRAVDGLGLVAPLAFIAGYALAAVAFAPALPITILGGLLFGPFWGTVYASVGSTLGACGAFLIGRYAARALVEQWVAGSPALARFDRAATRYGVRLVIVTRTVPLFPYNIQNYVYGVTGIGFGAYALTSWLGMLPSTAAFAIAGGTLTEGGWDPRRTLLWIGGAASLLVLVSLLPRWLRGKSPAFDALLR
jgi:uncharacterized membrane protein YdjX (TVP38/TMEM64 family)